MGGLYIADRYTTSTPVLLCKQLYKRKSIQDSFRKLTLANIVYFNGISFYPIKCNDVDLVCKDLEAKSFFYAYISSDYSDSIYKTAYY